MNQIIDEVYVHTELLKRLNVYKTESGFYTLPANKVLMFRFKINKWEVQRIELTMTGTIEDHRIFNNLLEAVEDYLGFPLLNNYIKYLDILISKQETFKKIHEKEVEILSFDSKTNLFTFSYKGWFFYSQDMTSFYLNVLSENKEIQVKSWYISDVLRDINTLTHLQVNETPPLREVDYLYTKNDKIYKYTSQ